MSKIPLVSSKYLINTCYVNIVHIVYAHCDFYIRQALHRYSTYLGIILLLTFNLSFFVQTS